MKAGCSNVTGFLLNYRRTKSAQKPPLTSFVSFAASMENITLSLVANLSYQYLLCFISKFKVERHEHPELNN